MNDRKVQVTGILESWSQGEAGAQEELWPIVYEELRELAHARLRAERRGSTLQTTMLVHEAYLRLVGPREHRFEDRAHFFGAAAQAMRRVLVDRARSHGTLKRGGAKPQQLDELDVVVAEGGPALLELEDALAQLEERHPRAVRVVELRFFSGLTIDESAEVLGVSRATVVDDWRFARAWLTCELEEESRPE